MRRHEDDVRHHDPDGWSPLKYFSDSNFFIQDMLRNELLLSHHPSWCSSWCRCVTNIQNILSKYYFRLMNDYHVMMRQTQKMRNNKIRDKCFLYKLFNNNIYFCSHFWYMIFKFGGEDTFFTWVVFWLSCFRYDAHSAPDTIPEHRLFHHYPYCYVFSHHNHHRHVDYHHRSLHPHHIYLCFKCIISLLLFRVIMMRRGKGEWRQRDVSDNILSPVYLSRLSFLQVLWILP